MAAEFGMEDGLEHLLRREYFKLRNNLAMGAFTFFASIMLLSISSCDKLQSDTELRKDIVGGWVKGVCSYPYNGKDEGVIETPLSGYMIFQSDGSYIELGRDSNGILVLAGGLRTYCVPDSCGTGYCTCTWTIEDGKLTIHSDGNPTGYDIEYPILCLNKDRLVLDNVKWNTVLNKRSCFRRD